MTTLHLIRHGTNDALEARRLAGRDYGLHLNDAGRAQAERRAESMREISLAAILASPLPRCQDTAAPLARLHGLEIETREELLEIEFADWTGASHADLDGSEEWKRLKAFPAGNTVPGGETLADARARMLRVAIEVRGRFPDVHVALVGHGDPLMVLLMQLVGLPDDLIRRLEYGPCGWATIAFGDLDAKLIRFVPI